jgi:hypothetical protein
VPAMSYERITMMLKTRHRAWPTRGSVLALTLAAFLPLAIPAAASASTFPSFSPPGQQVPDPPGNVFINEVNAVAQTSRPVFNVKFQLGIGATGTVSAVNRARAQTECAGCSATAIAFQVVSTTARHLHLIQALDAAKAINTVCTPDCSAVADAYQVVVATDTPWPLSFAQILGPYQLYTLYQIRSEVLGLPHSGLTISQVQSKCEDLVSQVTALLADSWPGTPSYTSLTAPSFQPAPSSQPIVKLYRDTQFFPQIAG